MLKSLKNIGVRCPWTIFGTGYSSLSYLRQFPIDALKLDQSFVQEISATSRDAPIVSAVISMGNSLKKRVIAEGVETREPLDFLTAQGCEEGKASIQPSHGARSVCRASGIRQRSTHSTKRGGTSPVTIITRRTRSLEYIARNRRTYDLER